MFFLTTKSNLRSRVSPNSERYSAFYTTVADRSVSVFEQFSTGNTPRPPVGRPRVRPNRSMSCENKTRPIRRPPLRASCLSAGRQRSGETGPGRRTKVVRLCDRKINRQQAYLLRFTRYPCYCFVAHYASVSGYRIITVVVVVALIRSQSHGP